MPVDLTKLQKMMDQRRFMHSSGVVKMALEMAGAFGADQTKTEAAAWLHDCARCRTGAELLQMACYFGLAVDKLEEKVPDLLHGRVGAEVARVEFGIKDAEILNAIRHHTLGDENMTTFDKIVFVADMVEPGRDYPGVEPLRKLAVENLDEALLAGLNSTIKYVISTNGIIHPKSIMARNAILQQLQKGNL